MLVSRHAVNAQMQCGTNNTPTSNAVLQYYGNYEKVQEYEKLNIANKTTLPRYRISKNTQKNTVH